jgi:hypothetical protein
MSIEDSAPRPPLSVTEHTHQEHKQTADQQEQPRPTDTEIPAQRRPSKMKHKATINHVRQRNHWKPL